MMLPEDGDGTKLSPMDIRDWANPSMEDCDPRRRRRILISGASVFVVVFVIVIATVTSRNKNGGGGSPTYVGVTAENQKLYNLVKSLYIGHDMPSDDLLREGSYQNKAFNWLGDTPDLEDYPHDRKIQRFSLACFYFATNQVATKYNKNPTTWKDDTHWLTTEHECDWPGVICTDQERVQSISLEHNDMSGSIPIELGMIWENLKVLELSFNGITVEGDDWKVFTHLKELKKIAMSANHVVSSTGIPQELLECKHLGKLLLSDNMISGPLESNGVMRNMQKLSHLEMEYNQLSGNLAVLSELPALEQVYLRHNELNGHLEFMKSDNLSNLLSIWLDSNDIVKTIPTEIGKLTELRSLSIAYAKLTGPIPSEIGLLTNLQRLWLFNNQLTGAVPSELANLSNLELLKLEYNELTGSIPHKTCKAIEHSSYAKSAVAADCAVDCECCTECF